MGLTVVSITRGWQLNCGPFSRGAYAIAARGGRLASQSHDFVHGEFIANLEEKIPFNYSFSILSRNEGDRNV